MQRKNYKKYSRYWARHWKIQKHEKYIETIGGFSKIFENIVKGKHIAVKGSFGQHTGKSRKRKIQGIQELLGKAEDNIGH